jgi:hypothetical protein
MSSGPQDRVCDYRQMAVLVGKEEIQMGSVYWTGPEGDE